MRIENSTTPLLSISLLTSNRKDTIRKCLNSLDALRRAVPSELIIVDTGCDEEMRSIIGEYTDHIVKFTWVNDFAAARNAGLSEAKGEWFLFIDDDEWFENTDEIEQFFLSGDYQAYDLANYVQRNYADFEGTYWEDQWTTRIARLGKEVRFAGRIHECLPYREKLTYLHSYVHHYGYVFHSKEERYAHSRRNILPLEELVQEEPNNLRWYVQLAQEYSLVNEYEKLYEISRKGLLMSKSSKKRGIINWRAALVEGVIRSYCGRELFGEAKEFIRTERYHEHSDLCTLVLHGRNTELYFREMNFPKTVEYGTKYAKQYQKFKAMDEMERDGALVVLMANEFYTSRYHRNEVLCYLFVAALRQGDTRPLERYFDMLDFSGDRVYLAADLIGELMNAMERFDSPYFPKIAAFLLKYKSTTDEILTSLVKRDQASEPGFEKLVKIFASCDSELPYIFYLEIRQALASGQGIDALATQIAELPCDRWEFMVKDIVPHINPEVLKNGVERKAEFLEANSDKEKIFLEAAMPVLEQAGLAEKKYSDDEMQELYTLADSLCENARKLWEQGDEKNAESLILQLRKLVPDYQGVNDLFETKH